MLKLLEIAILMVVLAAGMLLVVNAMAASERRQCLQGAIDRQMQLAGGGAHHEHLASNGQEANRLQGINSPRP